MYGDGVWKLALRCKVIVRSAEGDGDGDDGNGFGNVEGLGFQDSGYDAVLYEGRSVCWISLMPVLQASRNGWKSRRWCLVSDVDD